MRELLILIAGFNKKSIKKLIDNITHFQRSIRNQRNALVIITESKSITPLYAEEIVIHATV